MDLSLLIDAHDFQAEQLFVPSFGYFFWTNEFGALIPFSVRPGVPDGRVSKPLHLSNTSICLWATTKCLKERGRTWTVNACFFFIHMDHQPAFAWTSSVSQSGLEELFLALMPSASSFSTHWLYLLKLFRPIENAGCQRLARWMSDVVGMSLCDRGEKMNRGQCYDLNGRSWWTCPTLWYLMVPATLQAIWSGTRAYHV